VVCVVFLGEEKGLDSNCGVDSFEIRAKKGERKM
jgi:hypothetical protein